MNATRLIGAIEAAGCTIAVEGCEIVVRGARALPPELAAEVQQSKAELLAALTGPPTEPSLPSGKPVDDAPELDRQRTCASYVPHAERAGFGICGQLVVLGASRCPEHQRNFLARQQRLRDAGLRTWPEVP